MTTFEKLVLRALRILIMYNYISTMDKPASLEWLEDCDKEFKK